MFVLRSDFVKCGACQGHLDTTERLLERLQAIEDTLQGKGNQLQWVVELLRSREVSWAQIGTALGISRQSAWVRFT